jgi:hypothetical protein
VELLEEIVDRTSEDRFSKLMQNPRWQSQLHGLYSRIARNDHDGKYSPTIARRLGRAWSAPKGEERREALKLALYAAGMALRIAEQNHLRGAELDSLVCLGEAQFAAGEIDNAAKSFALGIEKNFGGRGLGGGPDINPDQRACCQLYLARIAIARFDYEGARHHLDAYKLMLPLEHEWVNDLSKEIEAEFEERLENKLIIEFNKDWSYKEIEKAFIRGLAMKLNLRHRRVAELENKLQLSRPTIYRLRQSLADAGESAAGKKKTKRQRGRRKESET